MINIVFWNTDISSKYKPNVEKSKYINNVIIDLVMKYKCDIIVLAEYGLNLNSLCTELSIKGREFREGPIASDTRVKLLIDTRFLAELIRDSKYYFACTIKNYAGMEFLLSGVHLPSKLNANGVDRDIVVGDLMNDIRESEESVGHEKSIIVGDFNADPFEEVMIKADKLHAIPYANIVEQRERRIVYSRARQIFYNPMWNFMGDYCNTSACTYYCDVGGAINLYKNIFDQVIFSAHMIKYFLKETLQIMTKVGNMALVDDNGIPSRDLYSDHLPIMFSIREEL